MTKKIMTKTFWITLLWKQNKHHKHGVFLHTMRVAWYSIKYKNFKMLPASLLHDIGKPFSAYQKEEDILVGEYSFTDHEEISYQIIKNWRFVSDYSKDLVRYHYLIRDIKKHKIKDPKRYAVKKKIWDALNAKMQTDLETFLHYDDLGEGQ